MKAPTAPAVIPGAVPVQGYQQQQPVQGQVMGQYQSQPVQGQGQPVQPPFQGVMPSQVPVCVGQAPVGTYPQAVPVQGAVVGQGAYPQPVQVQGAVVGQGPTTTVVVPVVQQQVIQRQVFGAKPSTCVCPSCHQRITTRTVSSIGTFGLVFAAGACFFGCCPCACLPCCLDDLKDQSHYCPHCNTFLGRFSHNM